MGEKEKKCICLVHKKYKSYKQGQQSLSEKESLFLSLFYRHIGMVSMIFCDEEVQVLENVLASCMHFENQYSLIASVEMNSIMKLKSFCCRNVQHKYYCYFESEVHSESVCWGVGYDCMCVCMVCLSVDQRVWQWYCFRVLTMIVSSICRLWIMRYLKVTIEEPTQFTNFSCDSFFTRYQPPSVVCCPCPKRP